MQFGEQIGHAAEIVARVRQALFGLTTPFAVARDTSRFLQKATQILGARLQDARDHALTNNGVRAGAQPRSHKQVVHIATANALMIDLINALTIAAENSSHGKLRICGPWPPEASAGVFEQELNAGPGSGSATVRTRKDDVLHRIAAQLTGSRLAKNPTNRIHDVGLAAAVRADNSDQTARKFDRGGIHKGLESRKFDLFESHNDLGSGRGSEGQ